MHPEKQKLTLDQLIEADPETLSNDDMIRRINYINLRKSERELDLVENQNRKFADEKFESERRAHVKTEAIKAEEQKRKNEQGACRHKSGGKGRAGFFSGDGKWGYCISTQMLSFGEIYFLCFRCQKEWRLPKKRHVLNWANKVKGEPWLTLEEYRRQVAEYNDVASWDKPLFETGEIPACCQFSVPKLRDQQAKDDVEFSEYLTSVKEVA